MSSKVVVSREALSRLVRLVDEEVRRLESELAVIEEELRMFEEKYGVRSDVFLEMLRGERAWSLPEGSEPDVVEWEALLEQKKRIMEKLKELDRLWRQLRDYNKY